MGHKRNLEENGNVSIEGIPKKKLKKLDQNGTLDVTADDENESQVEQVTVGGDDDDDGQPKVPRTRRDLIQLPYDEKLQFVSVIAQPMAGKKLAKKIFKLLRKASKVSRKEQLRIGLKEVQLRIRKGERGLVVFAGDVTPIEIMCHLPAVCETNDLPYVYVPFRTDISAAIGVRRPALMVLVKKHDDYADLYDECETKMKEIMLEFMKNINNH